MNTTDQQIILAPLHGFTEYTFRNVYCRHFTDVDWAISPFISLNNGDKINPRKVKDLFPDNNKLLKVIPQILGNDPHQFVNMANYLYDMGYEEVNWNLGCPIKKIANKKRGSGLLPYPKLLDELLNTIIPSIKNKLSVKIRLGYNNPEEAYPVINVLNKYPLNSICIHPRIGVQMYEGDMYTDVLKDILKLTPHNIIYSGDINSLSDFKTYNQSYPIIRNWMIGRGLLHNPFLAQIIKNKFVLSNEEASVKYHLFINDLMDELLKHKSELPALYKMKDYWQYISLRFKNKEEVFDTIIHTTSISELRAATDRIFLNEPINNWIS